MTAVVSDAATVLDVLGSGESRTAWARWLTERLEPGWRPGEWNPQSWFFDGDPGNDLTGAGRCEVLSCRARTDGLRMCTGCMRLLKLSGMTRDKFASTYAVIRRRIPNGPAEPCLVTRDDIRCVAPSLSLGLCYLHYGSYRRGARKQGVSLPEWLLRARPYTEARPECLVAGCVELVVGQQQLCQYHQVRYFEDRKPRATPQARALAQTQVQWAQHAEPFVRAGQFSLWSLHPLVRLEVLYAVQRRAARGGVIQPRAMRQVVNHVRGRDHLVGVPADRMAADNARASNEFGTMAREIERWLTHGHEEMCGVDPRDRLVWDLRQLNLHAKPEVTGVRSAKGTLDFTVISQDWLRELMMRYCATATSTAKVHRMMKVARNTSMALEVLPGGGHTPAELGPAHLDAITAAFRSWATDDGLPHANEYRHNGLHNLFVLLGFGRRAGLLDDVPSVFTPDPKVHRIKRTRPRDDEVGRAIPEPVIAQLDRHLHLLRCPVGYRRWTPEQMDLMFRTLYIVLRDTGRRPQEVCSLRTDCVEHTADGDLLLWDNHKIGRRNRRLPITAATAQALTDWQQVRATLNSGDVRDRYLFPNRILGVPDPYLTPKTLNGGMRVWVDERIPELLDDTVDANGQRRVFDRKRIYPYAFRHSYVISPALAA